MPKGLYLTIDDAPSKYMVQKIDYLSLHKIPALFYLRGEFIEDHIDKIIYGIENNFLMGNHSFTHPYFSKISIDQCIHEILETEKRIDYCYEKARRNRPCKFIRFPFGDRGAGSYGRPPSSTEEIKKYSALQDFLKDEKFERLPFQRKEDRCIDALWDIDVEDYKQKMIQHPLLYKQHINAQFENFLNHPSLKKATLLLHDFEHNHHLFNITMEFFKEKKVVFLEFD